MRPEEFILTTDYATLKNDDSGLLSLVVPGSMSLGSGAVYSNFTDINLGGDSVNLRAQINSSRTSTIWTASSQVAFNRTGTLGGMSVPYTLLSAIDRIDVGTLRVSVGMFNPYPGTMITQAGSETITFDMRTFLSPFN